MTESNLTNPTESSAAGKESSPTKNAEGKFALICQYIVTGNFVGEAHVNSRIIARLDEQPDALPLVERMIRQANSHDALLAACKRAARVMESAKDPMLDGAMAECLSAIILAEGGAS